jgi:hypothetical protein
VTTFNGRYLKEPADIQVCAESDLITVGAKIADVDPGTALTFAELFAASAPNHAAVVAAINGKIPAVENEIESYATRRGYAIPLSPVDAVAKKLAARMLWIDLRQLGKSLTSTAAEEERDKIRRGDLESVANGKLPLTAAMTATAAPSSHVYRFTDAATRDTDGGVPRLSRKSMGGW